MAKKKYPQIYDGQWIRVSFPKGFYMKCCDCGLVHKLMFKVTKNGTIKMQAFRHNEN